jgi:hypothetical protein
MMTHTAHAGALTSRGQGSWNSASLKFLDFLNSKDPDCDDGA